MWSLLVIQTPLPFQSVWFVLKQMTLLPSAFTSLHQIRNLCLSWSVRPASILSRLQKNKRIGTLLLIVFFPGISKCAVSSAALFDSVSRINNQIDFCTVFNIFNWNSIEKNTGVILLIINGIMCGIVASTRRFGSLLTKKVISFSCLQ